MSQVTSFVAGDLLREYRGTEVGAQHLVRFLPVHSGHEVHERSARREHDFLADTGAPVLVHILSHDCAVRYRGVRIDELEFCGSLLRVFDIDIPCVVVQAFIFIYVELVHEAAAVLGS